MNRALMHLPHGVDVTNKDSIDSDQLTIEIIKKAAWCASVHA